MSIIDKEVAKGLANLKLTTPTLDCPNDEDLHGAIGAFITRAMQDAEIAEIVNTARLTLRDVSYLYSVGITCLLPNPLIKSGSPIMAVTLLFLEPLRLRELVEFIAPELNAVQSPEERKLVIAAFTEPFVRMVKEKHDRARGAASMPPAGSAVRTQSYGGGGCAGLLAAISLGLWMIS